MCKIPAILCDFDLDSTDKIVRSHLKDKYLDHPTRGPYVKSRDLYKGVKPNIDERFTLELFGMFCESRPYLEKWSRGYSGSYRYHIIEEEL